MERPEGQRPPSSLHSTPQSAADAEWHPSISFPPFHALAAVHGRQRGPSLLSSPNLGPAQKYLLVLLLDTPTFLDEFFTKALGTDRDRGCSIEIDPECECFIPDAEDRSDGGRINGRVARNRIKKARSDGEGGAGPI